MRAAAEEDLVMLRSSNVAISSCTLSSGWLTPLHRILKNREKAGLRKRGKKKEGKRKMKDTDNTLRLWARRKNKGDGFYLRQARRACSKLNYGLSIFNEYFSK